MDNCGQLPCVGLVRHTDFRRHSLKPKTTSVDPLKSSLEKRNVSSLSILTLQWRARTQSLLMGWTATLEAGDVD